MRKKQTNLALVLLLCLLLNLVVAAMPSVSYAASSRFALSGETYPATLTEGSSFSLQGTLTGTDTITRVEVGVVSKSTGQYVEGFYYSAAVSAKSFNIANADSTLKFGQLPAGNYYYRITAYDSAGSEQVLNKAFSVEGLLAAPADTGKRGWSFENGEWYYYLNNGTVLKNGWVADSVGWCYVGSDGKLLRNNWAKDSGGWCWLNSSGYWYSGSGWMRYGGEWYYLGAGGRRVDNAWLLDSIGWCYAGSDGKLLRNGWARDSHGWCWMNASGYWTSASQWVVYKGHWCFIKPNGYRATSEWAQDSAGWCWMDANGYWDTANRWVVINGAWYYIKANGYRAANEWARDSVGWCWLDANGRITASKWLVYQGSWYYLKANGYMAASEWAQDSVGWCWLDENGRMVRNQWIETDGQKYYVNANGYLDQTAGLNNFPPSYQAALQKLQKQHPNWVFFADNTGVSWNDLLAKQKVPGRNLVEPYSSASYINQNNTTIYDGRWRQASDAAIAYYLDPRNFLTEEGIYQFMDQRNASNPGTTAQVKTLVSSNTCFMNNNAYITAIVNAGNNSGVNPAALTAMVIMEQGWGGTSGLISGTNSTYPGIYNHFNVGAYTANGMTATLRGLWWASGAGVGATSFGRPWNTIEKSLTGGAAHYKSGYIDNAQYTYYTKKYNVMNGTANVGSHQYMTNANGAYSEGRLVKMAYANDNSKLVFHIPVFTNMPSSPAPAP